MLNKNQRTWLFNPKWAKHLIHPWLKENLKIFDKHENWRKVAKMFNLSKIARLRLEWIIYYHQGRSASQTARHFGVPRKTFYKWFNQFDEDNIYSLNKLEDKSKAPQKTRQREITPLQEQRIIVLRKRYIRYGKIKLAKIYEREHNEKISSWKIQKAIEKYQLYYHPVKNAKIQRKRRKARTKKRITELSKTPWFKKSAGYIICLDTIVIYWHGVKRYILTAIDKYGKFAYARMFKSKSSLNAQDFLYRLHYLLNGQVPRVGHDNGTEFEKYFKKTCQELKIEQYYSRPRTPKDNPENERFNRILKDEFISLGNFTLDIQEFNKRLTEWLIEYNFKRPHQALGYKTPLEFSKVLPMYSSCTSS